MKNIYWISLMMAVALSGCHSEEGSLPEGAKTRTSVSYTYPEVIPLDSANKMLGSYLGSIDYLHNDTDLRSISFSAQLLRKMLDSVTGSSNITGVKIMFAHSLSYINAGHANQPAGYKTGALTLIIAGYKANGDYVYYPTNLVIDNGIPCPTNCPPGNAGDALFPAFKHK